MHKKPRSDHNRVRSGGVDETASYSSGPAGNREAKFCYPGAGRASIGWLCMYRPRGKHVWGEGVQRLI